MAVQIPQDGAAIDQRLNVFGVEFNGFVVTTQRIVNLVQFLVGCGTDQPQRRKVGVRVSARNRELNRFVKAFAVQQEQRQ